MNGSIHQASEAAREALETSRRMRQRDEQRHRVLEALDRVIDSVEEINLSGRGFEPVTGAALLAMERETNSELPAPVRNALTPVDLHEALLDWQEQLLDRAVPARGEYREVDAEIDPPELRRRRRRRRANLPLRPAA